MCFRCHVSAILSLNPNANILQTTELAQVEFHGSRSSCISSSLWFDLRETIPYDWTVTIEQLWMKPILFWTHGFLVEQIAIEWQGWHSDGQPASTNSPFRFRPILMLAFGTHTPRSTWRSTSWTCFRPDSRRLPRPEKIRKADTVWHGLTWWQQDQQREK